MRRIKNIIKRFGGRFFKRSFSIYPCLTNIHVVFMYHRVVEQLPKGLYDPGLFVRASTFEMQIKELTQLFDVVPLENAIQSRKEAGKLCAITFDDGWLDNFEIAFPILKKYRVPATIFVPVALIGSNQHFWFESLSILANRAIANTIEKKFISYFHDIIPSWDPPTLSADHLLTLNAALKYFPANTLDDLVSQAYRRLDIRPSAQKTILDWNQVAEMGQAGVRFGSHGLQHYILPSLDGKLKREEIHQSLKLLQSRGVPTVPIFSYPNGDWDEECIVLLRGARYQGALTTKLGYNASQTHPFLLNRVGLHENISHTSDLFWFRVFQAMLSGSGPHLKSI